MSKKNIRKHQHFLQILAKSHPSQRKALVRTATTEQIKCLCEICLNILVGNVPVNIQKLKKHKNTLRKLAKKTCSIKKKKKLLINQTGGFLPLLAPAIVSALGGILGRVIGKRL